jgi:hypothetical protein
MDFWATFLGAAFGVVAGTVVQYVFQVAIERRNRKLLLTDLRKEAQYNLGVVNDMLKEVDRFRAAAQPAIFSTYHWIFRSKDMLGLALNRMISSGQLYRMFNAREITEIQQLQQFFNPNMEQQFVANRIDQLRDAKDIAGAHQFADFLDGAMNKGVATLTSLANKK